MLHRQVAVGSELRLSRAAVNQTGTFLCLEGREIPNAGKALRVPTSQARRETRPLGQGGGEPRDQAGDRARTGREGVLLSHLPGTGELGGLETGVSISPI